MSDDEFAFPTSSIDGFTQHGMTLRDWFAGQALSGLAANQEWLKGAARHQEGSVTASAAASAYELADAMLAARKITP